MRKNTVLSKSIYRKNFAKNRYGIHVMASAESQSLDKTPITTIEKTAHSKIHIAVSTTIIVLNNCTWIFIVLLFIYLRI